VSGGGSDRDSLFPFLQRTKTLRAERDLAVSRERHANRRTHELAAHIRHLKDERDRAVQANDYAARFLRAAFVDSEEKHVKPEWIDDLLTRLEAVHG
jgi:hypothetical protein